MFFFSLAVTKNRLYFERGHVYFRFSLHKATCMAQEHGERKQVKPV